MLPLSQFIDQAAPTMAAPGVDLQSYDYIIVAFSGGKDSLACLLWLLEQGADRRRVELWHHDVDGQEGSRLMDWPVTRSYCRAVAEAFDVPLYMSWKVGGFEREMARCEERTAPIAFETPQGEIRFVGGTGGKRSSRRRFPQVSADLRTRWCSAYLKADPGRAALSNQERFLDARTLFVTGERAAESRNRAQYVPFRPHDTDNRTGARRRRHVDQLMAVHAWSESDVWEIIRRHGVVPHPAYRLGWGRCSCAACIFGSPAQWASLRVVSPVQFSLIASYEADFGVMIARSETIQERAGRGVPYDMAEHLIALALSDTYDDAIVIPPALWRLPAGAFGDAAGPC